MAIEKQMEPSDLEIEETDAENIEVEIINPDAVSIDTGDGGVIIDFEGDISESITGPDHDANLAEFIDEAELESLASDLVGEFNSDRESRKDWARAYVKGLDLLGMKIEERSQPWQGASGASGTASSSVNPSEISCTTRPANSSSLNPVRDTSNPSSLRSPISSIKRSSSHPAFIASLLSAITYARF